MNPIPDGFAAVWPGERLMPLGAGAPDAALRPVLATLAGASDRACLAGLWLGHDFLDESHAISQELPGPDGAYWHALMHRREPDYWNSKYWFRRVGDHAIFPKLADAVRGLSVPVAAERFAVRKAWDACMFVDLCESAAIEGGELETFCRVVQRIEWNLLFAHCFAPSDG